MKDDGFVFQLQPMILPVEYRISQPVELPGGCETTTDEVWEILKASRAGDLDTVRRMVEGCPDLVHAEYNYTPPIHMAVREGHTELVRYLLDQGADVTYRTYRYKDSLWQMARDRGHEEIAAILESALPSFQLAEGFNDLIKAVRQDDIASVRAQLDTRPDLVTAANENGVTALHSACEAGVAEIVTLLLDRGADIEAMKDDGFKPIHSAIYNQHGSVPDRAPVTQTLRSGRLAGMLLARGAKSNIALAATFGDMQVVREYLAEDPSLANFEETFNHGESDRFRPLGAAVKRDDMDMARLLLSHGADAGKPGSQLERGAL